jgi:hypothetical protein
MGLEHGGAFCPHCFPVFDPSVRRDTWSVDVVKSENQALDPSTNGQLPWGSGKVMPVEVV